MTKRPLLLSIGAAAFIATAAFSFQPATLREVQASTSEAASVERLDPGLDAIVPAKAQVETLAGGFTWTEGPVWTRAGYLLFAEIPSNSIRRLNADGSVSVFLQPSGWVSKEAYGGKEPGSNGMTLDGRGRVTVAGHALRNVWRLESLDPHATRTVLADSYQGKALNSPNDLVYRSDGSLYFTDPPYGLRTQDDTDPHKELKVNGVYRIVGASSQKAGAPPDHAKLQLLISDLPRPNGIAFSPDEKTLYVSNSQPKKWMRYPVHADGTLGKGEVFFDVSGDTHQGAPDGMKVDRAGNLYSAGPGGVWIFSPAGKHLGTIHLPDRVGNLAWGGDGHTLYIMNTGNVRRIELKVEGVKP